jgi:hypothetical protein
MRQGGRHPKKDVEAALEYANGRDWTVTRTASGHRWGVAICGRGCSVSIWSTPKNPGNHAKAIRRAVEACPHSPADDEDGEGHHG